MCLSRSVAGAVLHYSCTLCCIILTFLRPGCLDLTRFAEALSSFSRPGRPLVDRQ
jgi:hypothetical protein